MCVSSASLLFKISIFFKKILDIPQIIWYNICIVNIWPLGQAVKTAPSQGAIMGSIPVGVTKNRQDSLESCRFYLLPIHYSLFTKISYRFLESNR